MPYIMRSDLVSKRGEEKACPPRCQAILCPSHPGFPSSSPAVPASPSPCHWKVSMTQFLSRRQCYSPTPENFPSVASAPSAPGKAKSEIVLALLFETLPSFLVLPPIPIYGCQMLFVCLTGFTVWPVLLRLRQQNCNQAPVSSLSRTPLNTMARITCKADPPTKSTAWPAVT